MEVKKYDKIVLDSSRSIDDIVAGIKAELSKQESENAGESYICYVSHAYSSGQNAGVNYIVVSDDFKRLNRLSSNVIQANAYTKEEINELIARVDAKIPVDEAKLAKQNELKSVEADILGKEQSIPAKRQELLTLNEQKRALEANLATITELINEKEQAGENTEILQAQKRQYESDIATKSSQITNLESEINQLNSDIEVLNQTKERLKREEALIQSPELATKEYVDELKANLDSKSSELNSRIDTKANADDVVNLTGEQTIEGIKTFSMVPVVATQPTDDNEIANKAYVDSVGNTKANANAVVNLTGNQTIAGTKTFSSPVVVPNATANTHAVNLTQLNTKANANATVNLTGNQTIAGIKTFSAVPVCSILPTADTQLANRNYVKKRGGYVAVTGGAINLNNGINFSLNLTAATNITVANAAANVGQTGEIFVAKGANIQAFSAPFNFRIAQSGFGANEVFSYVVVSRSLVRITRS
ncbi:hypothetical protein [Campylobacter lanienae]|uniref:hypothetical protein n=1 Tax=Campylobacter lanienae TaxID=75658 RepID=UPI000BB3EBBF|nr:hypothetical protein [Campylobacter lanienae]